MCPHKKKKIQPTLWLSSVAQVFPTTVMSTNMSQVGVAPFPFYYFTFQGFPFVLIFSLICASWSLVESPDSNFFQIFNHMPQPYLSQPYTWIYFVIILNNVLLSLRATCHNHLILELLITSIICLLLNNS